MGKATNTWLIEARGCAALFVMWVLFKPLVAHLAERRVVILGLFVDFLFFAGFSFLVTDLPLVFAFTMIGMLGMVNYPAICSIKSQKCSPHEQGQVLGSLSGVQSLSFAIGPLIFNNSYSFLTDVKAIAWSRETLGFVLPEVTIWYFGIALSGLTAYLAMTIPDPRDVFVPGAD